MRYEKITGGYFVRLERGEEVLPTLCEFVAKRKIGGGFIAGLGAVENITLGYFDPHEGKYTEVNFPGEYELANLTGNIAYIDGKPFVHAHATISDREMNTKGGHWFSGKVAATVECYIALVGKKFTRSLDSHLGLKLLDFKPLRK